MTRLADAAGKRKKYRHPLRAPVLHTGTRARVHWHAFIYYIFTHVARRKFTWIFERGYRSRASIRHNVDTTALTYGGVKKEKPIDPRPGVDTDRRENTRRNGAIMRVNEWLESPFRR